MTGFGAAQARVGDVVLSVEIRSVNQRHLDVKLNVPREYGPWEAELRGVVGAEVARGRAEVFVGRSTAGGGRGIALQHDVAAAYVKAWRELKREFDLAGELSLDLLRGRSELFQAEGRNADPEEELVTVRKLLARALSAHTRERKREGTHLRRDMESRTRSMLDLMTKMRRRSRDVVPHMRERLEKRLAALLARDTVDPARLAQETAILAERADVTEELVRLESHLKGLRGLLGTGEPVGKRIEFLLQEVNREINTVGSKANDLEMTQLVVDAKAELEKIREQVQNVE